YPFPGDVSNIFVEANGTVEISSPLYPSNYPNFVDATWLIETQEDRRIRITFDGFETKRGYDFFNAGDGNDTSTNAFFRWHGDREPPDIRSTGNQMWLRFTSDNSDTENGFSLSAASVPTTDILTCPLADIDCGHDVCITNAWQCDGQSDCLNGQDELNCDKVRIVDLGANEMARLLSTLHPSNYPDNKDITWILRAEADRKIRVTFLSFDTEYKFDLVRAGDGNSSAANAFFEWSWTKPPPELVSDGNEMWLTFTSDGSETRSGFSISAVSVPSTYTKTCSASEVDCGHSVCIPAAWQCDYLTECFDGRDEMNCGN
ncbi:bone morphogenetic protein 1-like, partial [Patiria miniata]|uniref:CUB domain-containing protein n=1 Tax=Patiria miniata TaxID=46514 RepID=A0A914AK77_PATMI